MSDSIEKKFSGVTLGSDDSQLPGTSEQTRVNEEDSCRGNPWKPINAGDHNALEADDWPEPSAPGDQRKNNSVRQPEEKFKRKIKWQNFEDQPGPSFSRGRGRGRGSFYSQHFATPTSPNRRGNYRPPGANEACKPIRMNGFHSSRPYTGRSGNVRMTFEQKDFRSTDSYYETCPSNDSLPRRPEVDGTPDARCSTDTNYRDSHEPNSQSNTSAERANSPFLSSGIDSGSKVPSSGTRKTYRERLLAKTEIEPVATSYEIGPAGRARRSFNRQPPHVSSEIESQNEHGHMVSSAAVAPLIPFQSVTPFAYIIPGAPGLGTGLWGTNLQVPQASTQHLIPLQSTAQVGVPHASVVPHPHAIIDNSQIQLKNEENAPYMRPSSAVSAVNPRAVNGDVVAELVDASQMITYINEIGWNNVVFPTQLKVHPTISSFLTNLVSSTSDDSSQAVEPSNDNARSEKHSKSDVVVVKDQMFFVPRNANKTKFLKFTCKLDYIRHHVEYYFSEGNLSRDSHLVSILEANNQICPLSDLLQFNRLRWVSTTETELLEAISRSHHLRVTSGSQPLGVCRVLDQRGLSTSSVAESGLSRPPVHGVPGSNGFDKPGMNTNVNSESQSDTALPATDARLTNHSSVSPAMPSSQDAPNNMPDDPSQMHSSMHVIANSHAESTASVNIPSPSQPSPFLSPSDSSLQMSPASFTQHSYYSPQPSVMLPQNSVSASFPNSFHPEMSTLLPTFYRVAAPNNLNSIGPYIPHLTGSHFPPQSSAGLFVQLVPTAQTPLNGSYQQFNNALLSRSAVGSINPTGMWVPFAGSNNIHQVGPHNLNQNLQPLFNVPQNLPNANMGSYAAMLPSMSPFSIPIQNPDSAFHGHIESRNPEDINQYNQRQQKLPVVSASHQNENSNYFAFLNNRNVATTHYADQNAQTSRATPKKVS